MFGMAAGTRDFRLHIGKEDLGEIPIGRQFCFWFGCAGFHGKQASSEAVIFVLMSAGTCGEPSRIDVEAS